MPQRAQLPPLPPELDRLRDYLLVRDVGAPSALPQITTRETDTLTVGFELDTLSWEYTQPDVTRGRRADGFLLYVWVERAGEDPAVDPAGNGYKLAADARRFFTWWPTGTIRSYAIAAYRTTWDGEHRTVRVTDPSWLSVT